MTKSAMKKRIRALKRKNKDLKTVVNNLHDQLEEYDVRDSEIIDRRGSLITEIHQKLVYQNADPMEILDELFQEEGLYWQRSRAA